MAWVEPPENGDRTACSYCFSASSTFPAFRYDWPRATRAARWFGSLLSTSLRVSCSAVGSARRWWHRANSKFAWASSPGRLPASARRAASNSAAAAHCWARMASRALRYFVCILDVGSRPASNFRTTSSVLAVSPSWTSMSASGTRSSNPLPLIRSSPSSSTATAAPTLPRLSSSQLRARTIWTFCGCRRMPSASVSLASANFRCFWSCSASMSRASAWPGSRARAALRSASTRAPLASRSFGVFSSAVNVWNRARVANASGSRGAATTSRSRIAFASVGRLSSCHTYWAYSWYTSAAVGLPLASHQRYGGRSPSAFGAVGSGGASFTACSKLSRAFSGFCKAAWLLPSLTHKSGSAGVVLTRASAWPSASANRASRSDATRASRRTATRSGSARRMKS